MRCIEKDEAEEAEEEEVEEEEEEEATAAHRGRHDATWSSCHKNLVSFFP